MAVARILAAACICAALAAAVCAWRVYGQGLVKRYPAFFSYLISQALLLAVPSLLGVSSPFYALLFLVAYPITWGIYSLMVRELYNQIFREFPGIAMYGLWSVYAAAALACVAALLGRGAMLGVPLQKGGILLLIEEAGRNIVFGLALSIIVLLMLISRYPLKLHRNVLVNCVLFSALLLAEAGEMLAIHLTNLRRTQPLDVALMAFNIACFGVWAALLTKQGEKRIVDLTHGISPEEERRRIEQLKQLSEWRPGKKRK